MSNATSEEMLNQSRIFKQINKMSFEIGHANEDCKGKMTLNMQ